MDRHDVTARGKQAAGRVDGSSVFGKAVRAGLVAYGVVHLLIAWIALQLAFGDRSGNASSDGALRQVAQGPVGGPLLVVVAAGFAALVVWQVLEAVKGHEDEDGAQRILKRVGSAGKAVIFAAIGWSALQLAMGSGGGSSEQQTQSMTAQVMAAPGGRILVGLVGVGIIVVAGYLVYEGLSEQFMEKLDVGGDAGGHARTFVVLGKVGYLGKGAALLAVGGLFIWAAWSHDPQKSGGLDQALTTVLQQPFGSWLLAAIAVGLASFGLFAFAWARHLDR